MVNVGVIGCGYWGPKLIRNFHELAEAKPTIVCDLDQNRLEKVQKEYPYVTTTTDVRELLESAVDAVVVATPVVSHHHLAREALLHNKHVLVEKPLTRSSQEAIELIELAEKRNLVLMVGHTYEYHPAVEFMCQLIKSGELGEIYYIDAARLNLGLFRNDVNVLWDLAPHDICIVLALLDKDPIAVSATGVGHIDTAVCDVAYMELKFPGKTLAHLHVSWLDPCKVRQITIVGSKKMMIYDDVSETEKIRIYDKGVTVPNDESNSAAWLPSYRYGDVTIPFIPNIEPLKVECKHFVQCVTEGKRPLTDGRAGLKIVTLLEAANKSLLNGGGRVKLSSLIPVA